MQDPISNSPLYRGLLAAEQRLGIALSAASFGMSVGCLSGALTAWASWLTGALWGLDVVWLVAGLGFVTATGLGALALGLVRQLNAMWLAHAALATADPVTGMLTRRHFLDAADREWARCRRYGHDGALLIIDTDHFRKVAQAHGNECAEALIRQVAGVVSQSLRGSDLLARYGDDQLALFLPNTDPMGALDVAERIRDQVAASVLRWFEAGVATTVSVGVASVGVMHTTLQALLQDGAHALDAARNSGRNCVRAAPLQPRAQPGRPSAVPPRPAPKGNGRTL